MSTGLRALVIFTAISAAGCSTSSGAQFDVEQWSNEILTCIGELQVQYPNAERARMWVVCEDEFWSNKQGLLSDLCRNDPEFASCDYRK
jgi:hypothetical protein